MCGRYGFIPTKNFYTRFNITNRLDTIEPYYNVAPGMSMPVVTKNSPNKITEMRWGLIPYWSKDPKIGYKMINARAEGLREKPSFRKPIKSQRCLIPASGFYEWQKLNAKEKQPYYFKIKTEEIFGFAGLYDMWKDAEGREIKSYTIITVPANKFMAPIHDRMPAILLKTEEELWLDCEATPPEMAEMLLKPYPEELMETYKVSSEVNNPRNNKPELINSI